MKTALTEIEQVKAEIEGEQTDKNRSRRKKEGIFYTPKYITKYIVDNTVGAFCNEKKKELGLMKLKMKLLKTAGPQKANFQKSGNTS